MNGTWDYSFAATELAAREHTILVRDWLVAQDVDEGSCGAIELALAEVLNNVVEHAYADGPAGDIWLSGYRDGARINISVRDAGTSLPGLKLPEGKAADLCVPIEDLPEGGFGWNLIRRLTSVLIYRRHVHGNQLELGFELPVVPG